MPGRPTIWMIVVQGPIALTVGAAGGCLDIFILLYPFSPLSPSRTKIPFDLSVLKHFFKQHVPLFCIVNCGE